MPPNQRPHNCSKFIKGLDLARRLPTLEGHAIRVRFLKDLRASRDKLYSERPHGQPVYAASFIRRREIFLDQALERHPRELARILVHELFHFAWVRLGNPARQSYVRLLKKELSEGARGELGWSAEMRKQRVQRRTPETTTRAAQWRDYACESFCDTAAWLYAGLRKHSEFTLAERRRQNRAEWFRMRFSGREIPI